MVCYILSLSVKLALGDRQKAILARARSAKPILLEGGRLGQYCTYESNIEGNAQKDIL